MNIAIIGLGLIGGSLAKSIKKNTSHSCYGFDIDKNTVSKAERVGAIDKEITLDELDIADIVIVCLFPEDTIKFIKDNADKFKKGCIVTDICGVKGTVVSAVEDVVANQGCEFIGGHPMAGREFSGFDYSTETMFDKASFILTPTQKTSTMNLNILKKLFDEIGFLRIVVSNCDEHDRVIAFTSQLAHVVSNAYVKSPTLDNQSGFSAGSFQDLTRVAKLDEDMWTSLFLKNKDALLFEIDHIIKELGKYRTAIAEDDSKELNSLLKEGRIMKENSLKQ